MAPRQNNGDARASVHLLISRNPVRLLRRFPVVGDTKGRRLRTEREGYSLNPTNLSTYYLSPAFTDDAAEMKIGPPSVG
ncbi:hypothetical protein PUN28_018286 [Cardiocondyla obscurior]|uniref:Uncharacterized protein n=1 Tax=Cardiocondyla obscurior TaxID=286306 RepID=A0AAW2EGP7_9HYME